tara:strand:- start:823 stop:1305 length:483 start_codon:yes stop_codon:yes gene_type:complete
MQEMRIAQKPKRVINESLLVGAAVLGLGAFLVFCAALLDERDALDRGIPLDGNIPGTLSKPAGSVASSLDQYSPQEKQTFQKIGNDISAGSSPEEAVKKGLQSDSKLAKRVESIAPSVDEYDDSPLDYFEQRFGRDRGYGRMDDDETDEFYDPSIPTGDG